jgi:UDP-N-acetylmuramate dehydrogenase
MQKNIDLKDHNSFAIAVRTDYFCCVSSVQELQNALHFGEQKKLPVLILGGGSNVLLRNDYPGLVIQIALKGVEHLGVDKERVRVRAAAGENWHGFVSHCLAMGWHGLENLALIPGTVGAAPIQNIGAYGIEVKDFISELSVFDRHDDKVKTMRGDECGFAYRDSRFKNHDKERFVILAVDFLLHCQPCVNLEYEALAQALAVSDKPPAPRDVFETVCDIRRCKLPDPSVLGNAGSFFKNPLIPRGQHRLLLAAFPELPAFPAGISNSGEEMVKIPAAWLLERAGWKGASRGRAGVYSQQPLVLVNLGGASAEEITTLAFELMTSVEHMFGIRLEPEVQWVTALTGY